MSVSTTIKGRDKWHFLRPGASWDRSVVPIYEAAARGKCVPLLKTLLTSHCRNECTYCAFRAGRKCPRTTWEPKKLAEITMRLWEERKIMEARKNVKIRYVANLEQIIGANLTRRASQYVELKDKRLTDFLKVNKGN